MKVTCVCVYVAVALLAFAAVVAIADEESESSLLESKASARLHELHRRARRGVADQAPAARGVSVRAAEPQSPRKHSGPPPSSQRAQSSQARARAQSPKSALAPLSRELSDPDLPVLTLDSRQNSQDRGDRKEPKEVKRKEVKDVRDMIDSEVKECPLATSNCMQLSDLVNRDYTLGRTLVEWRRLQTLFSVDVCAEQRFDLSADYIFAGVTWVAEIGSEIAGVKAVKDVVSAASFIHDCYEKPKMIGEWLNAMNRNLHKDGPKASLLVFPDILFGSFYAAFLKTRTFLGTHGDSFDAIKKEIVNLSGQWPELASKFVHCSDKVMNHVGMQVLWWLGEVGFVIADACTFGAAAAAHTPYAISHAAATGAGKAAELANKLNIESKLQFILLHGYLMEAYFTRKLLSPKELAVRPQSCKITAAGAHHGCPERTWCQIEFSFVKDEHAEMEGNGWCMPQFGAHVLPEGSPCMDNSDCQSDFCWRQFQHVAKIPRDMGLALTGFCRVPVVVSTPDSDAVEYFEFHLRRCPRDLPCAHALRDEDLKRKISRGDDGDVSCAIL